MRQPKFLRHLVEKFLLKGDEGNANLHAGIMPVWDTQPLGVTRLPEVPCKIFESIATDQERDLAGIEVNEPLMFTQREGFGANDSEVIFRNMPVGIIFRWKFNVAVEDGGLTGPITWTAAIDISGTATTIYLQLGVFNPDCTCPQLFDTGWLFSQHAIDLLVRVASINPVSQDVIFSSQLCLYPNRELC